MIEGTAFAVLNTFVIAGILVSAFLTVYFKDLFAAILSLGVTGAFVSLEFILLQAPDVAIAEASVGAVLSTVIYIITLRKVRGRKRQ